MSIPPKKHWVKMLFGGYLYKWCLYDTRPHF